MVAQFAETQQALDGMGKGQGGATTLNLVFGVIATPTGRKGRAIRVKIKGKQSLNRLINQSINQNILKYPK